MTKISLKSFINKTIGKTFGTPWSGSQAGQCVSLVQHYLIDCLEQPAKARGNAKDWQTTYVREGLGKIVKTPKKGDIVVYNGNKNNPYGHIAIYIDKNTIYNQNGDGCIGKCNYSKARSNPIYLRPNAELIPDENDEVVFEKGTYKTLTILNVNKGPGTNYGVKKVSELTVDGKKNATSNDPNHIAEYKKGTIFTLQEAIPNNKQLWAKTPSGYICIKSSNGNVFIEKI